MKLRIAAQLAAGGLWASLGCSDSTGAVSECPGAQTVRLHFVNSSNTPELRVSATYGSQTCGPVDLPVQTDQGLELAQLLIEGEVGDVITVAVVNAAAVAGSAECVITEAAGQTGVSENRLQTFVNVFGGPPPTVLCAEGLAAP